MAEEEKERVTLDDVVEVLAKHSPSPNDPDDADKLTRFNQQVIDDRKEQEPDDDSGEKKETPSEARGRKPGGTHVSGTQASKEGP
jgi:hypothetical protein